MPRVQIDQCRRVAAPGTQCAEGGNNYRTGAHRTVLFERLPSQAGVLFLNRLPNSIKNAPMPKAFKARLKSTLVANAFYNTDEFMAFNWETLDWQTD
ncbi:hypothetical protein J6590_032546 [Homalodisca vitripennis]|nr:hypothetical protein J6590_032546 [Homalodisca vitripennis]